MRLLLVVVMGIVEVEGGEGGEDGVDSGEGDSVSR